MEDRLKNLKKIMDQRTFQDFTFSEKHKKNIFEKATRHIETDEDIQLAVLQLLVQAKTGFELTALLRGRGIRAFENKEGAIYTILHRLEQTGYLHSNWDDSGAKYYELNDKGRKLLKKADKKQTKKQVVFKALLEGGGFIDE
ncbi:PadR family transcriptional regulator [Neobacillus sp. D3-1R]|uniref:PadR family transcriptional regulator n=1 Tax=Neobacillus sp. D3-1R TaxID=3445778 RepID=UPI003F9EF3B3